MKDSQSGHQLLATATLKDPLFWTWRPGSNISTLLHDKIKPKDCQVFQTLGDSGFLQFLRVVSNDYGKPRITFASFILTQHNYTPG